MQRWWILFSVALIFVVILAFAGEKEKSRTTTAGTEQMMMPKPAAEHQKLNYFVGTWEGEETLYPSEFTKGGKGKSTSNYSWTLDGFFLIDNYEYISSPDPMMQGYKGQGLIGYDMENKGYKMWWFDNMGHGSEASGSWRGDNLIFESEMVYQGKPIKEKFSFLIMTPSKFKFMIEQKVGNSEKWQKAMEAIYTKQK